MKALIVHIESNHRANKQNGCPTNVYSSKGRAQAAMNRSKFQSGKQRYPASEYQVMTIEEWQEADVMVETINILNPSAGPIMIRKSEQGGCCDPGTERYHCM